jgi:hypothetical protein
MMGGYDLAFSFEKRPLERFVLTDYCSVVDRHQVRGEINNQRHPREKCLSSGSSSGIMIIP